MGREGEKISADQVPKKGGGGGGGGRRGHYGMGTFWQDDPRDDDRARGEGHLREGSLSYQRHHF